MSLAIEPVKSASAPDNGPIKGFGEISPLGCGFMLAVKSFATMWEAMQKAGIQEANLSTALNNSAIYESTQKDTDVSKLQQEIISTEKKMAASGDPSSDAYKVWLSDLSVDRTKMSSVKSEVQQLITVTQSNASDATNKFGSALKSMNTLFDVSRESINKIVGTLMTYITIFSNH